jgi:hypothetical protein
MREGKLFLCLGVNFRLDDLQQRASAFVRSMDAVFSQHICLLALKINVWGVGMEASLASQCPTTAFDVAPPTYFKTTITTTTTANVNNESVLTTTSQVVPAANVAGMSITEYEEQGKLKERIASNKESSMNKAINYRSRLIITGFRLASSLQHLISTYTCLYVALGEYFPAPNLRLLLFAVSALKKVSAIFFARSNVIASTVNPYCQV